MERFKDKGVTEIQFLSHSYFGEEDNNLHFQHQSFAEILLAEYYLKVFVKFALETNTDIDVARSKLVLGEPTEQTIQFFKELLYLLKETVSDEPDDSVLEKRKLLYPLFAALAMGENNTLHSQAIQYKWFDRVKFTKNSYAAPEDLINDWAIKDEEIEKIMQLAKDIIDSKTTLVLAKTEPKNALFNKELTVFTNMQMSNNPTDIDKWLALLVGNLLHTYNVDKKDFFNGKLDNPENLFEMIRNWNYYAKDSAPSWSKEFFKGILMEKDDSTFSNDDLIGMFFNGARDLNATLKGLDVSWLNFSYSSLVKLSFDYSNLMQSNFQYCTFQKVSMHHVVISGTRFKGINVESRGDLDLSMSVLSQYLSIPHQLAEATRHLNSEMNLFFTNSGAETTFLSGTGGIEAIFNTLEGLISLGLDKKIFSKEEVMSWFEFGNKDTEEEFKNLIDGIEEGKSTV